MAKLRIDPTVLENLIFGYAASDVRIVGAVETAEHGAIVMEIVGDDVPDSPEVRAICTLQSNRAGQRLLTMTFEPV